MNQIQKTIHSLDRLQQRNRLTAFLYAVIKKYGEDQAGYQSALLTYYGFLSLFPLLLVLATITGLLAHSHPALQSSIIHSVTNYFPTIGNQLTSVKGIHKSGLPLVIGVLFTFYGARGVADAFRNGVNHIWRIPIAERDTFPKSLVKSLLLVFGSGVGLILASACTALTAGAGHGLIFKVLSILVNITVFFGLFSWLLNTTLPHRVRFKDVRAGALTAAVGLVLLQTFGAILLKNQLKNLDAVYSYFAVSLGLLFWLYLQAQVVYYSVEIASVRAFGLWPRSFDNDLTVENTALTSADKKALKLHANEVKSDTKQRIETKFRDGSTKT